jgi:feruloyl esterase
MSLHALRISFAILLGTTTVAANASTCADLVSLPIENTTITSAVDVPAGVYDPLEQERATRKTYPSLVPAFCRVAGITHPVPASTIRFEVWLPALSAWNHKIEGTGNGAYSNSLSWGGLINAIRLGYAASSTDTGHSGGDLKFAIGHPERIEDWGNRAIHVTAQIANAIVTHYYGAAAQHAYFNGCSTGGHQALSEAQRYPQDYDGILAGDAGNDRVHLNVGFLWDFAAAHPDGKALFTDADLHLLHNAAIAACDAKDGVKDGILSDPLSCGFDPVVLLCKASQTSGCFTQQQVDAARKIYAGPRNPRTGEQIIAGYAPGSEIIENGGQYLGWQNFITTPTEPQRVDFWKYWVFNDPNWDWHTFDYDHDVATGDQRMAAVNASSGDLQAFEARGGKLLIYHGWADPVGPPHDAIDYYEKVEKMDGERADTRKFARLFFVPGMSHCGGGTGYEVSGGSRANTNPDDVPKWKYTDGDHDMLSALDRWVTAGTAPDHIIAFHRDNGQVTRTVPVCPYPETANYLGKGDPADASSYECKTHKP